LTADDENFNQPPLAAFAADSDRATLLGAHGRQYNKVELPPKSAAKRVLSFLPPDDKAAGPKPALDRRYWSGNGTGPRHSHHHTLNIDWGSWPGSPAYLPFVHELARHAALGAPPRVVAAGEPLVEYLPAKLVGLEGTVATPDGRTLTVRWPNRTRSPSSASRRRIRAGSTA